MGGRRTVWEDGEQWDGPKVFGSLEGVVERGKERYLSWTGPEGGGFNDVQRCCRSDLRLSLCLVVRCGAVASAVLCCAALPGDALLSNACAGGCRAGIVESIQAQRSPGRLVDLLVLAIPSPSLHPHPTLGSLNSRPTHQPTTLACHSSLRPPLSATVKLEAASHAPYAAMR